MISSRILANWKPYGGLRNVPDLAGLSIQGFEGAASRPSMAHPHRPILNTPEQGMGMSRFVFRLRPTALAMILAVVLGFPGRSMAHRVNVFAYAEGNMIRVECGYSRSERVRFGDIEVQNAADGTVYLSGKTDEKGNFAFPVPQAARTAKADLRILLRAGEGHQNACLVKAGEYLEAASTADDTPAAASEKSPPASKADSVASATPPVPAAPTVDAAVLRSVVEEAVEKKIAPLRAILLEEKQQGPGMTEIVGGIGYLVGIAGFLAYARSLKGSRA